MTVGRRIQVILQERGVKQAEFARNLGISANYVSLLINGKKNTISEPLAKLIEECYGYSADWILSGRGEKITGNDITAERAEILKQIQKMTDGEVRAVLAFVKTLEILNKKAQEHHLTDEDVEKLPTVQQKKEEKEIG